MIPEPVTLSAAAGSHIVPEEQNPARAEMHGEIDRLIPTVPAGLQAAGIALEAFLTGVPQDLDAGPATGLGL
jgi:hypothetical protein